MTLAICSLGIVLALLSISLGLYRLNTTLQALNSKIPTTLNTTDTFNLIEQLAWSSGRSFEQGRRTDR